MNNKFLFILISIFTFNILFSSDAANSEAVQEALNSDKLDNDDKKLREAGRLAVRRTLVALYGKRPVIEVQIVRI